MNLKLLTAAVAAVLLTGVTSYQWGYHKAWDAGRQDLVEQQRKKAQLRLEKQIARQHEDDTRAAAAEEKGQAETRVITRDVVKYVTRPDRTVCKFDDERVELKRRAVENANSIEGYDHE